MLLSGTLSGGQALANRAQLLDAPVGKGMWRCSPFARSRAGGRKAPTCAASMPSMNCNDFDAGKTSPPTAPKPVGRTMIRRALRLQRALVATSLVIAAHASLGAQQPTVTTLPKPTTSCGGPLALILVTVVDAKGIAVADATIDVALERGGEKVPGGMGGLAPSGEYLVMDDMALPLVPPAGARFIVRARRGKETGSIVLHIGRTPDGCHVRRLGEPAKLVLRR